MLRITTVKEFKITKISERKIHFKIGEYEYFLKNEYDCGDYWSELYSKRREGGKGRNNTIKIKSFDSYMITIKTSKPKKHYAKQILLIFEQHGIAITPFHNLYEDMKKISMLYNEKIDDLSIKIEKLREEKNIEYQNLEKKIIYK